MQTAVIRIGELAKRTTLSIDTIRFYEKRQLLAKPTRSTGGFRLYTTGDIQQLHFIRVMHELGFSLREIRELLELRASKATACESVRERLRHELVGVRVKMRELRKLESALTADLQKCDNELKHRKRHAPCDCPVLQEASRNEN